MPLWYGHPARTASQGSAAAQCLPSRSGSPRRRGGSSPTAHSVHSRPSRRRIRLSSRLPRRGRRQHGFSASTTVRWAWATSWRTLATCASELCKILLEWRLCVLRDQQSKGPCRTCVSGWRQSKVHLRKHPQVLYLLFAHDQCYSPMISALSPCEKALARQNTMRHRRCARESALTTVQCAVCRRCRLQRECRCTSPSICPSPTCGRREAPSGQREERATAE